MFSKSCGLLQPPPPPCQIGLNQIMSSHCIDVEAIPSYVCSFNDFKSTETGVRQSLKLVCSSITLGEDDFLPFSEKYIWLVSAIGTFLKLRKSKNGSQIFDP